MACMFVQLFSLLSCVLFSLIPLCWGPHTCTSRLLACGLIVSVAIVALLFGGLKLNEVIRLLSIYLLQSCIVVSFCSIKQNVRSVFCPVNGVIVQLQAVKEYFEKQRSHVLLPQAQKEVLFICRPGQSNSESWISKQTDALPIELADPGCLCSLLTRQIFRN